MQESGKKTFLGLNEEENGPYDIVILPIPYEITTSYREGMDKQSDGIDRIASYIEDIDRKTYAREMLPPTEEMSRRKRNRKNRVWIRCAKQDDMV